MTEPEILDRVRLAFRDAWIPVDLALERDVYLDDIAGLDSVSRVRLILTLESAFNVEILPKENSQLRNIGDLVDLIAKKRGA